MVMLLGVLVACGGSDEPADTTKAPTDTTGGNGTQDPGTQAPSTGGATTLPPAPEYTPSVDPVDFGDADGNARNYVTMVRQSRYAWFYGTEDVVSLAAYKRNEKLNEMYNINMSILEVALQNQEFCTL